MDEKRLTHIDLFSGIGGFTFAAEWAGFKTVVFCEKEKFCQEILKKRFGAIAYTDNRRQPRNIREAVSRGKGEAIPNSKFSSRNSRGSGIFRPLLIPEIRDVDGTKYRGAALLTGGFPCQPFSVAGQRRGKEDDRYLWPEMRRVIGEAKPRWILAENVPGIFHMALDTVLADLEGEGYTTGTFIIPACGLNAPHRRNRVWIIGYSSSTGTRQQTKDIYERKAEKAIGEIRFRDGPYSTNSHASNSKIDNAEQYKTRNSGQEGKALSEDGVRLWNKLSRSNSHPPDSKASLIRGIRHKGKKARPQKGDELFGGSHRLSWEENWYEIATNLLRVDDGFSGWFYLYRKGINNATTIKDLSRQDLQELQKIIQQKEVSERMGRLWQIPQEGTLFPILCELQIRANRPNYISSQGEDLSGGFLRSVWDEGKSRSASQEWRHSREHRREHTNTLPSVPYEIALEIKEAWDCISYLQDAIRADRTKRLKALGNAIVPQIAYEILKNIAWIENENN